jgi:hypothetical protein
MEHREYSFQLIGNRFSAIIAVCLTGILTAVDLRALFIAAPHKASWLLGPLDSWPLPIWSVIALNLLFRTALLWGGVLFLRGTQGKERLVVAGWFMSACLGMLNPIEALSAPPAIAVIRLLRTIGMSVAFLAALLILLKSPAFGRDDAKTALRLLLFLGTFIAFIFLASAALYFIMP